jgi:transposase
MMFDRPLRGAACIAKALGISERTVRRMVENGTLLATKLNGRTSPLVAERSEIERLRRGANPGNTLITRTCE